MSQTLHSGYKTSWSDISIQNMPRFRVPDSSIVHLQLPQPPVEDEHKKLHAKLVNPNEDVKFSLTFADHKLILPWTVVFDAAKRRSLQKLVVTFSHDQFDVDGLEFHTEYGGKIARLDPDHPSLTAFVIEYRWKGVSGEDFAMGIFLMFVLCLLTLGLLGTFVYVNYDAPSTSKRPASRGPSYSSSSSLSSQAYGSQHAAASGAAIRRHHSGYRSPVK